MSIKMEFFIEKMVMWKRYAFASKVGWWAPKQLVPIKKRDRCGLFSTPAGVRTLDTLIKSQVLYQLSYGCMLFLEK